MSTHKSLLVTTPGDLRAVDVPTPSPGPTEVLIKVAYTTLVPFDVEVAENGYNGSAFLPFTPGFSVAGTVAKVGADVGQCVAQVGDRVTGYAIPKDGPAAKGGQEYAVLPYQALAKVPSSLSLEAAASIPDNFVTAWWVLSHQLKLDLSAEPGTRAWSERTFIVYGASSTTGQYILQLLALFGCTRVMAIASRTNHVLLKSLGAAGTIDYHDADWAQQVLTANNGKVVDYAIDIISTEASLRGLASVTGPQSQVSIVLPIKLGQERLIAAEGDRSGAQHVWELTPEQNPFDKAIQLGYVRTFSYYKDVDLYESLMSRTLTSMLERELIKPTAKKTIDESDGKTLYERVKAGFGLLRTNAVSGYKVVVKVHDSDE
ncbi:GroES-like protein [Auricularia subglabra TFB-10046 SS5]|nr:GroES-like protein [Auricularia subglabra TFB-10046 SS5]